MNLLSNIDIPDLATAIAFHRDAFGLTGPRVLALVRNSRDGPNLRTWRKSQKGPVTRQ